MTRQCARGFEARLLSGFLDGELIQADEQRVRVHLEGCAACRAELEELRILREVMMTTRAKRPDDDGWDERPHGTASRLSRLAGWWIAGLWLAVVGGTALVQAWRGAPGVWERVLVLGGLSGAALLLLSVLLDRLRTLRSDRYREVEK